MAKEKKTGAFFMRELSSEEFKALCAHRPTTRNHHAKISHKDVMKAAREIGKKTKKAFSAWMNEEGTARSNNRLHRITADMVGVKHMICPPAYGRPINHNRRPGGK